MSDEVARISGAQVDCEALRERIPAYCAGALDADERAAFEAALPACPQLAPEVAQYQRVMTGLLHAAPVTAPPSPAVRARLMAVLDDMEPARQAQTASPAPSLPAVLPAPRRASAARWLLPLAAVLALLLGLSLFLLNRVSSLEAQLAAGDTAFVTELGSGAPVRAQLVAADANSPQVGRMSWVATPDGKRWVSWLVVENLPVLAEGEVYRLWIERAGEAPLDLGSFDVTEAGGGAFVFVIAEPIEGYDRIYLTREALGNPAPEAAPVIEGAV
jgi:anti-sigma factor RsiW